MESLFVKEITVLGIGNTILSDEGFGVRVVEFLRENYIFPENVQLIDGGAEGGKIFHLRDEEILRHFTQKISAHEVGLQDILTMLEITGKKIPCVELLGAQPFSLDAGINLTPQMQKLLPIFAEKSLEVLTAWKVNWRKNL